MKLPILFKKTATGAIQQWRIETKGNRIYTTYGQIDGKLQEAMEEILEGKNLSKANATTPEEQADAQAQSEWTKKIERNGYVEDLDRAEAGETDAEGGIAPMLAKDYAKATKHLKFPCLIQRKYDGVRCIATYKNGKVTLWSRKREQMNFMPHIVAALEELFESVGFDGCGTTDILDGEIYAEGMSMQQIASFARQKTSTKEGFEQLQYHVYDFPSYNGNNKERSEALALLLKGCKHPLVQVPTLTVKSLEEIKHLHDAWVKDGYEGAILRNVAAPYEAGKRSSNLLKFKEFDTNEFKIVGVREGVGKFAGLAIFTCVTEEGTFECNAPGTLEDKKEAWKRREECFGQDLTVKHFGWTDDRLPRFPVPVTIRNYE